MQVVSVILDFKGKNHQFKNFLAVEKKIAMADAEFKKILALECRKVQS